MTNPEPPSAAPVAWCRSDEFAQFAQGRGYLLAFSEQRPERHPNCDMPLYAQPQANTAPDADQAEGPCLDDVAELCAEFGFDLLDDDFGESLDVLRDMITAAITRWRAPAAEPVAAQDTEVDWESMTARMDKGTQARATQIESKVRSLRLNFEDYMINGDEVVDVESSQAINVNGVFSLPRLDELIDAVDGGPTPLPAQGEVEELIAALEADAECVAAEQPDLMQLTDKQLTRIAQLLKGTTHA